MKITLDIRNYINCIVVEIDGKVIEAKKINFRSKATFEHITESGFHEIRILRKSQMINQEWKKHVAFDWLSLISGVPDFTLKEKQLEENSYLTVLKAKADCDVKIEVALTNSGFRLIESDDNVIVDIESQVTKSSKAKKRIRNAYLIPMFLLVLAVEIFFIWVFLTVSINTREFFKSVVLLCIVVLWPWFIYKLARSR